MKRMLGPSLVHPTVTNAAPGNGDGILMSQDVGASKTRWWLATVTIAGGASDLSVWGALAQGVPADGTDDLWGLHQDPFRAPLGKIGTAIPNGVYHFLLDGLGLYARVFFQKSGAGTVSVLLSPVNEAGRGN